MRPHQVLCILALLAGSLVIESRIISIVDYGAVPGIRAASVNNTAAINRALAAAADGDVVVVPTQPAGFFATGGISATQKSGITFSILGTLIADDTIEHWPVVDDDKYVGQPALSPPFGGLHRWSDAHAQLTFAPMALPAFVLRPLDTPTSSTLQSATT